MKTKTAKALAAISEVNEEALYPNGLEDAVVGIVERYGMEPQVLLDKQKCLRIFMKEGCSYEEALEHFEFNVIGAWVGDSTPFFMTRAEDLAGYS